MATSARVGTVKSGLRPKISRRLWLLDSRILVCLSAGFRMTAPPSRVLPRKAMLKGSSRPLETLVKWMPRSYCRDAAPPLGERIAAEDGDSQLIGNNRELHKTFSTISRYWVSIRTAQACKIKSQRINNCLIPRQPQARDQMPNTTIESTDARTTSSQHVDIAQCNSVILAAS